MSKILKQVEKISEKYEIFSNAFRILILAILYTRGTHENTIRNYRKLLQILKFLREVGMGVYEIDWDAVKEVLLQLETEKQVTRDVVVLREYLKNDTGLGVSA